MHSFIEDKIFVKGLSDQMIAMYIYSELVILPYFILFFTSFVPVVVKNNL